MLEIISEAGVQIIQLGFFRELLDPLHQQYGIRLAYVRWEWRQFGPAVAITFAHSSVISGLRQGGGISKNVLRAIATLIQSRLQRE